MIRQNPKTIFNVLFGLGFLVTFIAMVHAGRPFGMPFVDMLIWLAGSSLFVLWGMTPFLICYAGFRRNTGNPRLQLLMTGIMVLVLLATTYTYYDSFFVHPDAQGGLIFIFLPLYLDIALAPLVTILTMLRRFLSPPSDSST